MKNLRLGGGGIIDPKLERVDIDKIRTYLSGIRRADIKIETLRNLRRMDYAELYSGKKVPVSKILELLERDIFGYDTGDELIVGKGYIEASIKKRIFRGTKLKIFLCPIEEPFGRPYISPMSRTTATINYRR